MTDHDCVFWHYWITDEGTVFENPYEPPPTVFIQEGYACWYCWCEIRGLPIGGAP